MCPCRTGIYFCQAGSSCKWASDSQFLLLEYFDVIRDSPSQLYHSALPFSPSSSWLCKYYSTELSEEVRVAKGLPAEWSVCSRTVTLGAALDLSPWTVVCWGYTLAVGCQTGDIAVLDVITGSQVAVLSDHTAGARSLAFSSDGTLLVSGSGDKTVKLWDVQTGGVIRTFYGHTDWVLSVSISVDHTKIASGSDDNTIRLWDILTGESYHVIKQKEVVDYVSFSPTSLQSLISASGGKVQVWDLGGQKIRRIYNRSRTLTLNHTQVVLCQGRAIVVQHSAPKSDMHDRCYLFPNGRFIAVAIGSTIYIWDITRSDPHLINTFVGHGTITSLAFSSPSSLISSSSDGLVKFWQIGNFLVDPVTTAPKSILPVSAPIKSITLQAKDGITISSDSNGVVRIWDLSTGLCKESFTTPAKNHHRGDAQLTNGKLTFVWYVNRGIHIWDTKKGKHPWTHSVHWLNHLVQDVRISGDGSKIFYLDYESIQAWSIPTGGAVGKIQIEYTHSQRSFVTDGSSVWVHSPKAGLQGWNFEIPGPSPIQSPTTPPLHMTGTKLYGDNLSWIMNTTTGNVVFQLGGRFVRPINPRWDGQYLVAGYESGEVLILDFNHMIF